MWRKKFSGARLLRRLIANFVTPFFVASALTMVPIAVNASDRPVDLYTVNVSDQPGHSQPHEFVTHNGVTYFDAYTKEHGHAIWSVTPANPTPELVVDIKTDLEWGISTRLHVNGNYLYVFTRESVGWRPWVVDLSTDPVSATQILNAGNPFDIGDDKTSNFVTANGEVYFAADQAIYKVNPATGAAILEKNLGFGFVAKNFEVQASGAPSPELLSAGNKIFFSRLDLVQQFYEYDVVTKGLSIVPLGGLEIPNSRLVGNYSYFGTPGVIAATGTSFFFVGSSGVATALSTWTAPSWPSAYFANLEIDGTSTGEEIIVVLSPDSSPTINRVKSDGTLENLTTTIAPAGLSSVARVISAAGHLIFSGSIGSGETYLYKWSGTGAATRIGNFEGIGESASVHSAVFNVQTPKVEFHPFGTDSFLVGLFEDLTQGFEPHAIKVSDGTATLLSDMNRGTAPSKPDLSCFASLGNTDYFVANLPIQTGVPAKADEALEVLVELKGVDGELLFSTVDLGGLTRVCGFAAVGDLVYFTAEAAGVPGLYRLNADKTLDLVTAIASRADQNAHVHNGIYYWVDRTDALQALDLSASPLTPVELTNNAQSPAKKTEGKSTLLIGDSLYFEARDASNHRFIWRMDLSATNPVAVKISGADVTDKSILQPGELVEHEGKLVFLDRVSDGPPLMHVYQYDPVSQTTTIIIQPSLTAGAAAGGNTAWAFGSTKGRVFSHEGLLYSLMDPTSGDRTLFSRSTSGLEVVNMPSGFVPSCAAEVTGGIAVTNSSGITYLLIDGESPRSLPAVLGSEALCGSQFTQQGLYFEFNEYPYLSGMFGVEPGYLGNLVPRATNRLGQSVNEPPAVAFSNDPSVFNQTAPGKPGTPVATVDGSTVNLSWSAPTTGDSVTEYTISSSPAGATCTVTNLTASCTNLTAGTDYTFQVTASNGGGFSPISDASNSVSVSTSSNNQDTSPDTSGDVPRASGPGQTTLPIALSSPVTERPGTIIELTGERLNQVTGATIDGKIAKVSEVAGVLSVELPIDLTPGTYDLVLLGSFGSVSLQNYVTIAGSAVIAEELERRTWTQINKEQNTVRMIYKYPILAGKIQFYQDGKEIAWIRAVDETDPKLRIVELNGKDVDYLVRTRELTRGQKNVFEIYLDGQRIWRAAYFVR